MPYLVRIHLISWFPKDIVVILYMQTSTNVDTIWHISCETVTKRMPLDLIYGIISVREMDWHHQAQAAA